MSSLLAVNTVIIISRVPDSVGNKDICGSWQWREVVRIQHSSGRATEVTAGEHESPGCSELKKFRTEGT